MKQAKTVWIGLLLALPTLMRADVAVSYEEVWPDAGASAGVTPYRINLENTGADTFGTATVSSGNNAMVYPFELPKGTRKTIAIYPWTGDVYGTVTLTIQSKTGTSKIDLPVGAYGDERTHTVGVITDNPGTLRILRAENPTIIKKVGAAIDTYCSPENAPDRAVGYSPLNTLVLGEGSERLSDGAISAIKKWVLSGGHLMFVGGSQTPILNDARWQEILPVTGVTAVQASGLSFFSEFGPPVKGPLSLAMGEAKPGAVKVMSDGYLAQAHQTYGIGRVTFLAYNPMDAPLKTWEGRQLMLTSKAVQGRKFGQNILTTNQALLDTNIYNDPMGMGYSGMPTEKDDPFHVNLPHPAIILSLLVGFWVVVVPLQFIVLKQIGRRELAWVLAPIISVGFAGVFFSFARTLYKSGEARATQGIVFADARSSEGYFIGRQELFLPTASRYDLGFKNVETLHSPGFDFDPFSGSNPDKADESAFQGKVMDVGQVQGVGVAVPSLSFREYGLRQPIDLGGAFRPTYQSYIKDRVLYVDGEIRNETNLMLNAGEVLVTSADAVDTIARGPVSAILPGESVKFRIVSPITQKISPEIRVFLQGVIKGDTKVGASLGKFTDSGRTVRLVCMFGEQKLEVKN